MDNHADFQARAPLASEGHRTEKMRLLKEVPQRSASMEPKRGSKLVDAWRLETLEATLDSKAS